MNFFAIAILVDLEKKLQIVTIAKDCRVEVAPLNECRPAEQL